MMVTEAPQSPARLVEAIHAELVGLIGSGALAPESRLHQGSLAERFGVSRTPVREALLRLEQEGLVYTLPRRGMFVRSVSAEDIVHLYEVREVLEPWAVRRACLRATAADRALLERIQRRHEQHYPSFTSNRDFHIQLVQPCANEIALRILAGLWAQDSTQRIYSLYREQPDSWEHMVGEHRAIVDAFVGGDADSAGELVRQHIAKAGSVTVAGLTPSRPEGSEEPRSRRRAPTHARATKDDTRTSGR